VESRKAAADLMWKRFDVEKMWAKKVFRRVIVP
jgi:hypothetical protein